MSGTKSTYLSILSLNCRGIGKHANLSLNLQKQFNAGILLLQEHHKVKDAPIYLKGLSILQTNRLTKKGGSAAVALDEEMLKEDFIWEKLDLASPFTKLEMASVKIKYRKMRKPVIVSSVYLPPTKDLYEQNFSDLKTFHERNSRKNYCVYSGDWNADPSDSESKHDKKWKELIMDWVKSNNNMRILLTENPTRGNRRIDFVVTNCPWVELPKVVKVDSKIKSDHEPILFQIRLKKSVPKFERFIIKIV